MRCAVFDCNHNNNKSKEWRFFSFPKDSKLLKRWIKFCRRVDKFNIQNARICHVHFAPEDFDRNLQFEMGLCSKNPTKLKPGAYPTVKTGGRAEQGERAKRAESRSTKKMISALLKQAENTNSLPPTEQSEEILFDDNQRGTPTPTEQSEEIFSDDDQPETSPPTEQSETIFYYDYQPATSPLTDQYEEIYDDDQSERLISTEQFEEIYYDDDQPSKAAEARIKSLQGEVKELKRQNELLRFAERRRVSEINDLKIRLNKSQLKLANIKKPTQEHANSGAGK